MGRIGRVGVAVALSGALLLAHAGMAAENDDLNLIPDEVRTESPPSVPDAPGASAPPAADPRGKLFLENAATLFSYRNDLLVPPPAQAAPNLRNRLSLDARQEWAPSEGFKLFYSGRLNLFAEDDFNFPTQQSVRHDLREAYASWEAVPRGFLDLGRINLKSGVALGYNPTDFFKPRSVIDRTSQDPSVLRENRLGTLMARGQTIWEGGALAIAFAPSLYEPSRIYPPNDMPSFDPMFDRTNAENRLLVKTNLDLEIGLSPEFLLYHEGGRTTFGANLSHTVGQSMVVYGEWAGGRRASLIEEAVRYGQRTGSLPASVPILLPGGRGEKFQHDLTLGASYTTEAKITFNLEYHYHQAGMSKQDWQNWFDIGRANRSSRAATGQLWYIRGYALDQQEPLTRHQAFLRATWTDAFVRDLELVGLVSTNLYDGSSFVQLSANYFLSNAWTVGAIAAANVGRDRSERGSQAQDMSLTFKAIRYF
jgi:hypothetical protein